MADSYPFTAAMSTQFPSVTPFYFARRPSPWVFERVIARGAVPIIRKDFSEEGLTSGAS